MHLVPCASALGPWPLAPSPEPWAQSPQPSAPRPASAGHVYNCRYVVIIRRGFLSTVAARLIALTISKLLFMRSVVQNAARPSRSRNGPARTPKGERALASSILLYCTTLNVYV